MNKNLKKVISAAAALAVTATSSGAVLAATNYPDVAETATYAQAVEELTVLGIINGYDDGTFGPDNNVTRAEFAKMTVGALGIEYIASAESKEGQDTQFTDVPGTHWAAGWVKEGTDDGFINGYSDTQFGPDDNVTYAQAVKMLVCAVGYDYYAQQSGGWPAGYLSWGVKLGITTGVKAATDEIITRAQVAQMIDNALKAPICVVTDYERDTWGNDVPLYDKKDTASVSVEDSWESLLDYGHDVYDVYGRVTGTHQSGRVSQSDKAVVKIEKSNNFDGFQVTTKYPTTVGEQTVYVGESGAEKYLFTYAEMLIKKDENDDFTILTIYPQGSNTEVKFAASDYDDNKSTVDNMYAYLNGKDSKSTSYKLDKAKIQAGTQGGFYVNERQVSVASDDAYNKAIEEYVIGNGTGEVTLIDSPDDGKSSADGNYDYVKVTLYKDAIVDSVRVESDTETTVYFDNMAQGMDSSWTVDTDDDNLYYNITLNGEKISAADLQEGDVVSIAYDLSTGFGDSQTYTALVSRDVVTGTVQTIDPDDNELDYEFTLSDGETYKVADTTLVSVTKDLQSGEEYTVYLDAFGKIVKADQEATAKLIGIIDSVYVSNGDQYYANIFTKTGEKIQVNIKNQEKYREYLPYCYAKDEAGNIDTTKKLPIYERVYDYKLNSSNEVTIKTSDKEYCKNSKDASTPSGYDTTMTYKESTNKLGSYKINDSITSMLDISDYGTDGTISSMTSAGLDDDEEYEGYVFGKNSSDNSYQLILVEAEGTGFTTKSQVVVYSKYGTTNTDDGEKTTIYAYANGESTTTAFLLSDDVDYVTGYTTTGDTITENTTGAASYKEGDLLILKTNTSGEVTKVVPMFANTVSLRDGYDRLYNAAFASTTAFADVIKPANDFSTFYFAKKTKSKDKMSFQFGPIVDKSDNSITLAEINATGVDANGATKTIVTDKEALDDISYDSDVTIYVYDYDKGAGSRVSLGAKGSVVKTQVASANCLTSADGTIVPNDKELIDWTSFNTPTNTYGQVNFAFVKLVDDDVQEIYVIIPSTSRK